MPIQWEPRLALGVAAIDQQHRELIDAVNRLLTALAERRAGEEVGPLVEFLGNYTVEHFEDEERLMRAQRYPGLAAHRAEHQAFIATFTELAGKIAKQGPTMVAAIQLNGAVCEWLRKHIVGSDRDFANFLRQAQAVAR